MYAIQRAGGKKKKKNRAFGCSRYDTDASSPLRFRHKSFGYTMENAD